MIWVVLIVLVLVAWSVALALHPTFKGRCLTCGRISNKPECDDCWQERQY